MVMVPDDVVEAMQLGAVVYVAPVPLAVFVAAVDLVVSVLFELYSLYIYF